MTDTTLANEVTETSQTQAASERVFTQDEVNALLAKQKGKLQATLLKPYEDLGPVEELKALRQDAEQRRTEQSLKKGEFDKVIQELASKKDAEIQKRDQIIKEYKIHTPLVSAAAKLRSVNPEQVKSLLVDKVRLNADGDVEVVDNKGAVRYSDSGTPLQVEDLVQEFLLNSPHFVQASAATTNSRSNVNATQPGTFDISKLDMKNPAHRKAYTDAKKAGKV
jgi:hypothetical protein